ncbi:GIY-YIG nuclease family protein [Jeotgalibacillus haloalkalitolerans]|uniref:GIY-YIG nuclease family protein n=1 Tax=Jeotgalibacillus haloalkalitolerans TaxID=3104292 RepID=A0ABU5KN40_9BACL|nr:GIY-YIG nuclease family protein [Jeotgalibacillus sp. HH7-29]MDZ5712674.1 GIY-YIG nuclease family protein [Jeotgalibacillus sp. HH7-29]
MARGKSINLFLIDGNANGRIKCTLANWTGVAYRLPRTEIEKCRDREDLSQTGVYFLFGTSEDNGEDIVYVGQAGVRKNGEGVLNRLIEHKRSPEKDYWTEAVVFTTSNNSFGPTEISYLESRFCTMAKEAERYEVKNGNDPNIGNLTEEKMSELEEFIDYAKIVMGTLGHKVFEKLSQSNAEVQAAPEVDASVNKLLYLKRKSGKSGRTIEAKCEQTNEGFVVLKGSMIETIDSNRVPVGVKAKREQVHIGDDGILLENVLFKSPSYAAAFVIGGSANGLTEWKDEHGVKFGEIEENQGA